MTSGRLERGQRVGSWLTGVGITLAIVLQGCASPRPAEHATIRASRHEPPGPPNDPWQPYVVAASARFGIPAAWIREVMRQESGEQQYLDGVPTTSVQGAMGLMQVMPATYDELSARYALDADPYDPYNNILAGTAYIREMYDRFGFPAFLAAYNAGPQRLEERLYGGRPLPAETAAYVASVASKLGAPTESWTVLIAGATDPADSSADELNRSAMTAMSVSAAAPAGGDEPTDTAGAADMLNRIILTGIR